MIYKCNRPFPTFAIKSANINTTIKDLMPCKPDIMYQRIIAILFFLCACCIQSSTAYGQKVNYQQFDNIYLGAEASVVSCFIQDS